MIKGFNQPLPAWRSILNDKPKLDGLISYLQSLPIDSKVLRWVGGTSSKNYFFERDLTNQFHAFCIQAGVGKISIVVNPNDINGFIETYKILSANIEVVLIEFGNEDYLRSHVQKSTVGLKEMSLFYLNYNKLLEQKAIEYRTKFVQFQKTLSIHRITSSLAFCCDIPNDAKSTIWFNALKNTSNNCVIHVYGQPDNPNYHNGLATSLDKLKTHNIYVTEFNGIHFGDSTDTIKNENLEFSNVHFEFTKQSLKVLDRPNVKGVWHHMLFSILTPNEILSPYRQLTIYPNGLIKNEYNG